jgi:DtxR family Mn-dependent transcriptional regulator
MSASDVRPLASMKPGETGTISSVLRDPNGRAERLAALGVTPGARVRVLQTFPGVVFECDQTELAIERSVARVILVGKPDIARRHSACLM